jgi:hypothetical protein
MLSKPHDAPAKPIYAKFRYELIDLGLPRTLVVLYGVLEHMAGPKGECWPKQSTLAKMIGLKTRQQVHNLLNQLAALKLIEGRRTQYYCRYRILKPDVKWILHLVSNRFDISDVKPVLHRKEPRLTKQGTKPQRPPASQPASGSGGQAGRLAALITEAWPKLPGHPGPKLITRIEAILGDDIPLAEFRALLQSKARKVEGFGLAESLARELRQRRNGDESRPVQMETATITEADLEDLDRIIAGTKDPKSRAEFERAEYAEAMKQQRTRATKGAA